jgi:hypothetical protein
MLVFGVLSILDGFGSILVYPTQPLWPDHMVRILRMAQGTAEIILGVIIGVLIWVITSVPRESEFQEQRII